MKIIRTEAMLNLNVLYNIKAVKEKKNAFEN